MSRVTDELTTPPPNLQDYQFIYWLRNRLVFVYKENRRVVERLETIGDKLREETHGN